MGYDSGMNKFEESEIIEASLLLEHAQSAAESYAPLDSEAATIAVLILALELAGGKHFLKPQEENE